MTPYANAYDNATALREFSPTNITDLWCTSLGKYGVEFHLHRRSALNRVSRYDYVALWRWDVPSLSWVHVLNKCADEKQQTCDRCGGTTTLQPISSYHSRRPTLTWPDGTEDFGEFEWVREKGKIVDPPALQYLCARCRNA